MDNKTKYNKFKEVIDSMTEDERKSLEIEIEKSLNSYTPTIPSLEEYTRLIERQYMNDKITGDSK